jgi:hypothetical protein
MISLKHQEKRSTPRKTIDMSEIDIQDDIEDPKQWRAAVDPKTSKTYWYHRIRRISTWVRPVFTSDQKKLRLNKNDLKDQSPSVSFKYNQAIKENDYLMKTEFCDIQSSNENQIVNNAIHYDVDYKLQQMQQDQQLGQNDANQSKNRNADSLSSDFSIGCSVSNAVSCLTSSNEFSRIDAMLLLSSRCCIDVETSIQLAQTENLLNNLITIISGGDSKKCRQLSLKILCSLASCNDDNVKNIFYANQSWVIISKNFEEWNENESVLLYCILVSLLEKGPAQAVIPCAYLIRKIECVLCIIYTNFAVVILYVS